MTNINDSAYGKNLWVIVGSKKVLDAQQNMVDVGKIFTSNDPSFNIKNEPVLPLFNGVAPHKIKRIESANNKFLALNSFDEHAGNKGISIRPNPLNAFELTKGTAGGGTEDIEFTIQPEIGANKDMLQADLGAFLVNDIITISGFSATATETVANIATGNTTDESWINGTYRVTGFTDDGAATPVRTGIVVERLAVTHAKLDRGNVGGAANVVPAQVGHSPVIKKHFRISVFDAAGTPTLYV